METQQNRAVKKARPGKKGNREAAFFSKLVGSSVKVDTRSGDVVQGTLVWVGPYSVILRVGEEEGLLWKHSLESMWPAKDDFEGVTPRGDS